MLTVMARSTPCTRIEAIMSRIRSVSASASWAVVSGSSTSSSSPPKRPAKSLPRKHDRSAAPTAASTSSPLAWPKRSLICLKWSRSSIAAASGVSDRFAWATIRLRVSSVARLFGSPVRESLLARNSASARLRRLPSTGAACATELLIRASSAASKASSWVTSTEPITSPLTSRGSQVERAAAPC